MIGRRCFRNVSMRDFWTATVFIAVGTSSGAPARTKSFCISTITRAEVFQSMFFVVLFVWRVDAISIFGSDKSPAERAIFFIACFRLMVDMMVSVCE